MRGEEFGNIMIGVVIGVLALGILMTLTAESTDIYYKGYKQGQIDYANNKIKFQLKPNSDGTTSWKEIK